MIFKTLTVILISAFVYSHAPHPEVAKFFKLDTPAAVSVAKVDKLPPVKGTAITEPLTAPETPAPAPVTCTDKQWVRADGGGCIDKPVETVTPHAPVVATAGTGSCDLAYNFDWPAATARAICMAESGGNPGAVGDTSTAYVSCGLMQIRSLPGRPSCEQLKDGAFNMQYAYNMYVGQGFQPWSAYTNGAYQRHL